MAALPDHAWVRDAAGLGELAEALAQVSHVAVDSESNSMFAYQERVCLVQLNVGGELWLVDTLALTADLAGPEADAAQLDAARREALAPLAGPLSDPKLRIWIHGGEYDVACFKRDFDLPLAGLFDTQQAASLLGWRRTGYASVVEEVCGIKLTKSHTQYDWGRRPIDEAALRYALDDVIHLPEVGAELHTRVAAADLEEELEIANHSVSAAAPHENEFDPARMWRLKGVRDLRKDRHGVLAALFEWRDRKGRELDYPPGRLIANQPLVILAAKAPTSREALRRSKIRGSFLREHGDELVEVVAAALREPPEIPPRPRKPKRGPKHGPRSKALKAWRREEAERREVPPQVVLPPRALDWIAEHGGEDLDACPELGAKRAARYGAKLRELCQP